MPLRPRGLCSLLNRRAVPAKSSQSDDLADIRSCPYRSYARSHNNPGEIYTSTIMIIIITLGSPCQIPHEVTNLVGAEILFIQAQQKKKIKETVAFRVRYMYQAQALLTPARSLWL